MLNDPVFLQTFKNTIYFARITSYNVCYTKLLREELSTRKEILQAGILKELINFINDVVNGRI